MEKNKNNFRFDLRDGRVFEGPVLSRFQDINDLEQIRTETMDSDFITILNGYGRRMLLSKYQITAVEEL